MLEISERELENLGGIDALRKRVKAFAEAIEMHKYTVDVPAPTENLTVEAIVKRGGDFSIITEDGLLVADDRAVLALRIKEIKDECAKRINGVLPDHKQRNALAREMELLMLFGPDLEFWPPNASDERQQYRTAWTEIERLRAVSNELEDKARSGTLEGNLREDALWLPKEVPEEPDRETIEIED